MNFPNYSQEEALGDLVRVAEDEIKALSRWIDEHPQNAARDLEAQLWGRCTKVCEESGEVVDALILFTGQNPRKPAAGSLADVEKELCDVALTALAAIQHLRDRQGFVGEDPIMRLFAHISFVAERAGV